MGNSYANTTNVYKGSSEQSSGFHVLELHLPSTAAAIITTLVVLGVIAGLISLGVYLYRKCRDWSKAKDRTDKQQEKQRKAKRAYEMMSMARPTNQAAATPSAPSLPQVAAPIIAAALGPEAALLGPEAAVLARALELE